VKVVIEGDQIEIMSKKFTPVKCMTFISFKTHIPFN
jgi:hypothetical protein